MRIISWYCLSGGTMPHILGCTSSSIDFTENVFCDFSLSASLSSMPIICRFCIFVLSQKCLMFHSHFHINVYTIVWMFQLIVLSSSPDFFPPLGTLHRTLCFICFIDLLISTILVFYLIIKFYVQYLIVTSLCHSVCFFSLNPFRSVCPLWFLWTQFTVILLDFTDSFPIIEFYHWTTDLLIAVYVKLVIYLYILNHVLSYSLRILYEYNEFWSFSPSATPCSKSFLNISLPLSCSFPTTESK